MDFYCDLNDKKIRSGLDNQQVSEVNGSIS